MLAVAVEMPFCICMDYSIPISAVPSCSLTQGSLGGMLIEKIGEEC